MYNKAPVKTKVSDAQISGATIGCIHEVSATPNSSAQTSTGDLGYPSLPSSAKRRRLRLTSHPITADDRSILMAMRVPGASPAEIARTLGATAARSSASTAEDWTVVDAMLGQD